MRTPYTRAIHEAKEVLQFLIRLMVHESDMKIFKNMAAVYVVWQHELHNLQLEELR